MSLEARTVRPVFCEIISSSYNFIKDTGWRGIVCGSAKAGFAFIRTAIRSNIDGLRLPSALDTAKL